MIEIWQEKRPCTSEPASRLVLVSHFCLLSADRLHSCILYDERIVLPYIEKTAAFSQHAFPGSKPRMLLGVLPAHSHKVGISVHSKRERRASTKAELQERNVFIKFTFLRGLLFVL